MRKKVIKVIIFQISPLTLNQTCFLAQIKFYVQVFRWKSMVLYVQEN